MAAEAGADKVTAIEVFSPMAKMAAEIFRDSKFKNIIELISSRSTELSQSSLTERGNLIVAEVFDTELIGEGALRTFKEAHETLVKRGSRVIPSSARVWILPVESRFLEKFNKTPSMVFKSPCDDCPGSAAVFDVQLSQLSSGNFTALGTPFIAFEFNFEDPDSIQYDEWKTCDFIVSKVAEERAVMNAVLMWWDLDMDGSGKNILSMAPTWFEDNSPWRDHWLQAVYFLPEKRSVVKDESLKICCAHDEYSLWFSTQSSDSVNFMDKPLCKCQMHVTCARSSIFRMNDLEENSSFMKFLNQTCLKKSVVCINEGSLLGLYAAQFASDVTIVDSNPHFRMVLEKYKRFNKITNVVIVESVDEIQEAPSVALSEPFYFSSLSTWNNLRFWFDVERIRTRFPDADFEVFPRCGVLYAMPVEFEHLWKIASKVGVVEGHDLSKFDELCQKARCATDPVVEPQPLWEYASICTGKPVEVARFDITKKLPFENIRFEKIIQATRLGTNAITFWMDWIFTDELIINTGILKHCAAGDCPQWHPGHRQSVHFIEQMQGKGVAEITVSSNFQVEDGDITFQFVL
uniref:Protein arginine N-methyltransferase 7 n=1 Tax=Acrobeloides nanus TaxID=290746 RepID=A0A914E2L4_9BILA